MLNVSIVTFRTPLDELASCFASLQSDVVNRIFVVDNSSLPSIEQFCSSYPKVTYIPNANTGFGAGHNIALRQTMQGDTSYHLVLNSDVRFSPAILADIHSYMDSNADVAQLQPLILNPDGSLQFTCRLLPTPADLFLRRFMPRVLAERNDHRYLLKFFDHQSVANIPYHQGSFMFFRVKCLREVGLFDERFFMYPEDIDITRRMHCSFRTVFHPSFSVVHDHRAESYHSLRMTVVHVVNMCRYFSKWGWFFDSERKAFNSRVLSELGHR